LREVFKDAKGTTTAKMVIDDKIAACEEGRMACPPSYSEYLKMVFNDCSSGKKTSSRRNTF
jgi:hypothetical protein